MCLYTQKINDKNMESVANLKSPLLDTMNKIQTSSMENIDYLSVHCGIYERKRNSKDILSKYVEWVSEILADDKIHAKANPMPGKKNLIEARHRISHPNFTKNWGYINPAASVNFSNKFIYQIYLTRPSFDQFKKLVCVAENDRSILIKYARLKSLENRNDTVTAYTTDKKKIAPIFADLLAKFDERNDVGELPGFATLSKANLSLARIRNASAVESNGQKWQKIIQNASSDPKAMKKIYKDVQLEFSYLSHLLEIRSR